MKCEYTIEYTRSWWTNGKTEQRTVVGKDVDDALDRFWVYMWKTNRCRRNEVDIVRVVYTGKVVV